MAAPTTYYARFPLPPAHVRKGRADTRALTVESVLSAPYPDHAGDIVRPGGIDWSRHAEDPYIDLEHGRDPVVKSAPVAWARPSLSKPGPYHRPVDTRLNFGTDDDPEWHIVPVAKEWFDPSNKLSCQVFALCEQDALPGRSLEFVPDPRFQKAIGWSDLENRPAFDFGRITPITWSVCARPVNEYANQLTDSISKSIPGGVPPQLSKVIADRRVRVGGRWEPLCGVLLKALAPYAPAPTNRTVVRVEKAMDEDEVTGDGMGAGDTVSALEEDAPAGMGDDAPPSNGVTAMYAHVDAVQSAIDQLESDLQASDNPKIISDAMKMAEQMKGLLAKIKATADKHDAAISAAKGGEPDGDEEPAEGDDPPADDDDDADPDDTDEYEPDDEEVEKALRRDPDGVLKNIRPVYKKAIRAKRFSKADAEAGRQRAAEPDPERVAAIEAKFNKLTKLLRNI